MTSIEDVKRQLAAGNEKLGEIQAKAVHEEYEQDIQDIEAMLSSLDDIRGRMATLLGRLADRGVVLLGTNESITAATAILTEAVTGSQQDDARELVDQLSELKEDGEQTITDVSAIMEAAPRVQMAYRDTRDMTETLLNHMKEAGNNANEVVRDVVFLQTDVSAIDSRL